VGGYLSHGSDGALRARDRPRSAFPSASSQTLPTFNHIRWQRRRRSLDFSANADIMSDMKTFTVRELDREPAVVLDAADREGVVRIKRRDGRSYSIQPEAQPSHISGLPDFRARIRKIFPKPISKSQAQKFDELLAGE
jgi:hypothetical protein